MPRRNEKYDLRGTVDKRSGKLEDDAVPAENKNYDHTNTQKASSMVPGTRIA